MKSFLQSYVLKYLSAATLVYSTYSIDMYILEASTVVKILLQNILILSTSLAAAVSTRSSQQFLPTLTARHYEKTYNGI